LPTWQANTLHDPDDRRMARTIADCGIAWKQMGCVTGRTNRVVAASRGRPPPRQRADADVSPRTLLHEISWAFAPLSPQS
jgi:hypothetical protein